MYEQFLKAVLIYIVGLNAAAKAIDESDGMSPYVGHVPVIFEDELQGYIVDEIGGVYSYQLATDDDREWWAQRPWAQGSLREVLQAR